MSFTGPLWFFSINFPASFTLSATARPHNSTLRSKSFTSLRHFVCAVELPVAVNVNKRGNTLFKTTKKVQGTSIAPTVRSSPVSSAQRSSVPQNLNQAKVGASHLRCF
jgi:hypothetical protein